MEQGKEHITPSPSPPSRIELRSEEVQEILGKTPSWMIRWGITLIFLIVVGLFVGSYIFKYPHIVSASIVVTTENLPAAIVAKTNGKIDTFFVFDREYVIKNQYLGIIENPAHADDIFRLSRLLDSMKYFFIDYNISRIRIPDHPLSLGDLQSAYFSLRQSLSDYEYFVKTDYHHKKIKSIEQQIVLQRNMYVSTQRQIVLQEKQTTTIRSIFERDSLLYKQGAVSLEEFERSKNSYLQSQYALESAKSSLNSAYISIQQLEQTIFDLEQQCSEKQTQLRLSIAGAYENLKTQIITWEQTYLFKTPVDGIVTFTQYWQRNQNVTAGSIVLTVVPQDSMKIIGKIMLPSQGAGKVKVGQKVFIKFDNYPHMEYGMVNGVVENISLVPVTSENTKFYMVEVALPGNLRTNYNKELDFSQEMQGTADIITEDVRLIERFLNPIKSLIKRQ